VIRPETRFVPRFRQSASRTTAFPFYYILTSSSMFIAVVSLPGARYVDDQGAKNFMRKLTVLAVIRPETRCVPRFRQSASRTTAFPFYYILTSSTMFIAVVLLNGARYVEDKSANNSCSPDCIPEPASPRSTARMRWLGPCCRLSSRKKCKLEVDTLWHVSQPIQSTSA